MSIIGKLKATLGLDASRFNRALKQSEAQSRSFGARLKAVLKNPLTAIVASFAAVTTAVAALTRKSLGFIDQQAKVARTIDGSIDALRALQMAAGDAGVGSDVLNKSMQKLGARLVEAQVKGGASADALDRLGLSAAELSAMDADARLAAIADRVKELGLSSGETAQFLMDMGIESKEMALLLTQGGAAIRAARKEVDDLGLSLNAVDAAKVESANDAMSRIGLVFEAVGNRLTVALAPALEALAKGFTNSMREGGFLRSVIDGLGTAISATTRFFADMKIIISSFAEAGGSFAPVVFGLGLIRDLASAILSPFRAVFSAIGATISSLAALIQNMGSFGAAMELLGDVVREVAARIAPAFEAAWKRAAQSFFELVADIAGGMQTAVESVVSFANNAINSFEGAFLAIKAIWGALPAALGDLVFQAANTMIQGIGSMLNAAAGKVNAFLGFVNTGLEKLGAPSIPIIPELKLDGIENKYAGAASAAAKSAASAFKSAFDDNPLPVPDTGLGALATRAAADAAIWGAAADAAVEEAKKPLASLAALRDAIKGTGQDAAASLDEAAESARDLDDALGGAGEGAAAAGGGGGGGSAASGPVASLEKIKTAAEQLKEKLAEVGETIKDTFVGLVTRSKSAGDAIKDLLGKFSEMLASRAFDALWGGAINMFAGGGSGGGGGLLRRLFSFDGGGETGKGPRTGGVDGKGGLLAVLHPNETIIDHTKPRAPDLNRQEAGTIPPAPPRLLRHAQTERGAQMRAVLAQVASFEGGGHTGFAPRTGGMDGQGGRLAMIHPKERIIDETRDGGARDALEIKIGMADDGSFFPIIDGRVRAGINVAGPQLVKSATRATFARMSQTKRGL